jgi:hypothetical protein
MAKQTINIGSVPNDGQGSTLRDGGDLINDNFNEIYSAIGDGTTLTAGTFLTTTNSETVTNKTISGLNNTLSNIGNNSLINSFITLIDDTSTTQSISLGESFRFIGGSGITTSISGNTITFDTDGSIVTETSNDILTNKTIDGTQNTLQNIPNSALDSIANSALTNSSITLIDDTSTTDDVSLGESLRLTGGTGITSVVGSNEVTFNIDSTVATLTGTQELTNKTINASNNTLSNIVNANLSGTAAISNANLANPNITLGADTISLGATQTTITNLNLDGTSSLSGTGTIDITGAGSKARFNFAGFGTLPAAATYEGMFAYDTVGQRPYVADTGGWVRILDENSSVSAHADVNISGIADGHILKWSSSQARFNAVADSGGATDLTIVDDTSTTATITLATDTLSILGGTGLSSTISGDVVTLDIDSTVATLTGSQILTNKTINSNDNTITNIKAGDLIANGIFQGAATIDVTNSGSAAYLFNSHYSGNNPTLYLKAGLTYALNLNVTGHPFHLQTVSGAYSAGNPYTTGLTHVATDGTVTTGASALLKVTGTLYIEVPSGSSSTI